jgi:hypothetical protein
MYICTAYFYLDPDILDRAHRGALPNNKKHIRRIIGTTPWWLFWTHIQQSTTKTTVWLRQAC